MNPMVTWGSDQFLKSPPVDPQNEQIRSPPETWGKGDRRLANTSWGFGYGDLDATWYGGASERTPGFLGIEAVSTIFRYFQP